MVFRTDNSPNRIIAAVVAVFLVTAIGCGNPATSVSTIQQSNKASTSQPDAIRLKHDFGVVIDGNPCHHQFVVRNDTSITWDLLRITKGCSCTQVRVSANEVPAGESFTIDIEYAPPNHAENDRKTVEVSFKEDTAPKIIIDLSVSRRQVVTVIPEQITLKGSTSQVPFTIIYYTPHMADESLLTPVLERGADWFHVASIAAAPRRSKEGDMFAYAWSGMLATDASGVLLGNRSDRLAIKIPGEPAQGTIPVHLTVAAPIQARPNRVFFGRSRPGSAEEMIVLIHCAAEIDPNKLSIVLSESLQSRIRARIDNIRSNTFLLRFSIGEDATPGLLQGDCQIMMGHKNGEQTSLASIPVTGKVDLPAAKGSE